MKFMKKSLLFILCCCCVAWTHAQGLHFSQFYNAPTFVNPGNTGVFNGDIRAYTLYRMQWFTVSTPYKTFTISLDAPIFKKRMKKKDFFAAGINISNDNQGTVHLKTNCYNALVSFTKFIGGRQRHNITLGYEIGWVTKTAALGGIKWDSQWDGTQYNAALPSGEAMGGGTGYLDMSTGLVWTFTTDHLFRSALGFSFHHFTAPNASLVGGPDKLYPKLGVQWNANFKLSETSNTTIEPSIMASQQGTSLLVNAGANVKYVLTEHSHYTSNLSDKAIHIGVFYRLRDALYVAFRFDYADFSGAVAYDVNISGLTPASHSVGGFEIMLSYRGLFGNHKEAKRTSKRFMN
jgi:type IX secretion system PorP/SprF family membrane protein